MGGWPRRCTAVVENNQKYIIVIFRFNTEVTEVGILVDKKTSVEKHDKVWKLRKETRKVLLMMMVVPMNDDYAFDAGFQ